MTAARGRLAATALLLASAAVAHAQSGSVPNRIVAGAPIHRDVRGNEVHRLSIELEAGEYAYVSVVERDIDAHHRRHGDIPLRPVSRDLFEGPVFFRDVEFVRDAGDGIVALTVSRPRMRAERFERLAGERP